MQSENKTKFDNSILNISCILIVCIALIRPYISSIFKISMINTIIMIFAIFLLLIQILKKKKININKNYILLSLIYLIPFFYNNAYFQDEKWNKYLYYMLTIIFFMLYYIAKPDIKNFEKILKFIILFAFATSIITWIGFLYPKLYIDKIVNLLPVSDRLSVLKSFPNVNPGLSNHYSRNAFFIVIGIMSLVYFFIKENKKSTILSIAFLILSLFLVGKRGHLLFLIVSFLIAYLIYRRINIKTIIKLVLTASILATFSFLAIKYIPGANVTYERIIKKSSSADVSNGRIDMYKDIYELYKNNNYIPIGWGQYAKSTDYYHPGVHNDYIQLYCETGIIGSIIILGIDIIFLKKSIVFARKTKHPYSFLCLVYNIFFLLYALTGLPHYDPELYIIYFFINSSHYILINNYTVKEESINEKNRYLNA